MRSILGFALFAATTGVGELWPVELRPELRPVEHRAQHPDFGKITLFSLEEQTVSLSAYAAPVTVLVLWAVWCKPCLEELPYVEQLHQLYLGDRDVAILAISIDLRPEMVKAEVETLGLSMPVLIDADSNLRKAFSLSGLVPTLLYILPDFEMLRESGFNRAKADQFVADKRETIELARARIVRESKPPPNKKRVKHGDAKPGASRGSR